MKDAVYQNIVSATANMNSEHANAAYIAQVLNLSRSVVSQYLNQLFANGKLIKINTRPVIFFDLATLQERSQMPLTMMEYKSMEELQQAMGSTEERDFDKLIGIRGSLDHAIRQCKATLSYPPHGLPILLHGETGTGKSRIAQVMYEYAQHHEFIKKGAKFVQVNCSEYANNPELLTANLFGSIKGAYTGADQDHLGLIHQADGGILFLDEVHCLKAECQEKLFLFMDQGLYHMVGDNEKWYKANVRMIFATTEKPEDVLLKTLLRRIPMTIELPNLQQRGTQERLQLIYSIFSSQEKRIHRRIAISNMVYNALLRAEFKGNIGELENSIQATCVNALFEANKDEELLEIRASSLPEYLYSPMRYPGDASQMQRMIAIADLKQLAHSEPSLIKLFEGVLNSYQLYHLKQQPLESFLKQSQEEVSQYFDMVMMQKGEMNSRSYIQGMLSNLFAIINKRYGFKISNNDILGISAYLQDDVRCRYDALNWEYANETSLDDLELFVKQSFYREYSIAQEVIMHLQAVLDEKFHRMSELVLALILYRFHDQISINRRLGIIIAHGFSTASSIADAVNHFLGSYIFDAIDMPMEVNTTTIIEKLNQYLERTGDFEELILLVDMGSLEEIYKGILSCNANIGIMNNVNTKMALEIGNGLRNDEALQTIFDKVCAYNDYAYHIVENRKREKIILCSCASGIGSAEKLKDIIDSSIPKNIPIKVMTCDYNMLVENKNEDELFRRYEVICIVGTLNPNIESIRFIPIEDLIINETLDELDDYFYHYLSGEELTQFKQNILKNFSLSNIMNNLTILNPNKLLEHVADAIDRLQNRLDLKFSNHTCFGLYVHICCLIERLVTRDEISDYGSIDSFIKEHASFIEDVKECFQDVEQFYRIQINVEEIGYIYDYIRNN